MIPVYTCLFLDSHTVHAVGGAYLGQWARTGMYIEQFSSPSEGNKTNNHAYTHTWGPLEDTI